MFLFAIKSIVLWPVYAFRRNFLSSIIRVKNKALLLLSRTHKKIPLSIVRVHNNILSGFNWGLSHTLSIVSKLLKCIYFQIFLVSLFFIYNSGFYIELTNIYDWLYPGKLHKIHLSPERNDYWDWNKHWQIAKVIHYSIEIIPFHDIPLSLQNYNPELLAFPLKTYIWSYIRGFSAELFLGVSFFHLFIYVLVVDKSRSELYKIIVNSFLLIVVLTFVIVWFNPHAIGASIFYFRYHFAMNVTINFAKLVLTFCVFFLLLVARLQVVRFSSFWAPWLFVFSLLIFFIGLMTQHIFILALCLELLSLVMVLLIFLRKAGVEKNKAQVAFYYLVINGILSVPMFIGIIQLYHITTDLTYTSIYFGLMSLSGKVGLEIESSIYIGIYWILISLLFKLALAPLAIWVADVYDSTTTIITAFIMVIMKLGLFFIFLKFYLWLVLPFNLDLFNPFWGFIILSSLCYGFVAFKEVLLKRILAITSVNQLSFVLLGLLGGTPDTVSSSVGYMIIYSVTLLLLFTILCLNSSLAHEKWPTSLKKFFYSNRLYSIIFASLLFSMSGLPPFAGFYIKVSLLEYVYLNTSYASYVFISLLSSFVMLLIYIQLVIDIFRPEDKKRVDLEINRKLILSDISHEYFLSLTFNFVLVLLVFFILFCDIFWARCPFFKVLWDIMIQVYFFPCTHIFYEYTTWEWRLHYELFKNFPPAIV